MTVTEDAISLAVQDGLDKGMRSAMNVTEDTITWKTRETRGERASLLAANTERFPDDRITYIGDDDGPSHPSEDIKLMDVQHNLAQYVAGYMPHINNAMSLLGTTHEDTKAAVYEEVSMQLIDLFVDDGEGLMTCADDLIDGQSVQALARFVLLEAEAARRLT